MTLLEPQRAGIPLPTPTPVSRPFWAGCAEGELRYQRCPACGQAEFDPVWACRYCGAQHLTWETSAGRGEIYSYSVVWRPQTPEFSVPYAVVIVAQDEGFMLLTNLIGCETHDVRAGLRVRVRFHDVGGDVVLPYVVPDAEADHGY